jgi:hypothetical protein
MQATTDVKVFSDEGALTPDRGFEFFCFSYDKWWFPNTTGGQCNSGAKTSQGGEGRLDAASRDVQIPLMCSSDSFKSRVPNLE